MTGQGPAHSREPTAFGRYACIGAIGFAVDASLLTLIATQMEINLYLARGISFAGATLATWLLNRAYVFAASGAGLDRAIRQYMRYVGVQLLGATLNLCIFFGIISFSPGLTSIPIVPLAVGSLCALAVTYLASRRWVFAGSR